MECRRSVCDQISPLISESAAVLISHKIENFIYLTKCKTYHYNVKFNTILELHMNYLGNFVLLVIIFSSYFVLILSFLYIYM